MRLFKLCVKMAECKGVELDDETQWAMTRWEQAFGREVHTFADFMDAVQIAGPYEVGGMDVTEAQKLYTEVAHASA